MLYKGLIVNISFEQQLSIDECLGSFLSDTNDNDDNELANSQPRICSMINIKQPLTD